jgi:hypothetical protein
MDGLSGMKPVRKIVFEVCSKDQGWSDYPQDHGTHRGSWTWFEVKVTDGGSNGNETVAANSVGNPSSPPDDSEGRLLVKNIHAGRRFTRHAISWSANSEDAEEAKWVSGLKRGRVITMTAHAKYPGWSNHVQYAEIHVFTAAVR